MEAGDGRDNLPQDWRPSHEVFAKMTSKEKRQLRNKISARNFRIRARLVVFFLPLYFRSPKLVILILKKKNIYQPSKVAEHDRLLDHFRTQLGATNVTYKELLL